ncbi:MAG: glutamine--fructose-6-phosphate aminotransferase, partial [Desulfobulbaceae bacterium]
MCGIVGYIGDKPAVDILIDGLQRLEYRGYDSAGVAIVNGGLSVEKKQGKVKGLSDTINRAELQGTLGIGHTRWATHGRPNDVNAHPHTNSTGKFAIVHNGIIENFTALKEKLITKGYSFESETDT